MEYGNGYLDSLCLQSLADFDSTPALVGHFVHYRYLGKFLIMGKFLWATLIAHKFAQIKTLIHIAF